MAGSTTKKVMVRRFDREPLAGFINPRSWLQPGGVELLRPDGAVIEVRYGDIQWVSFVKEFDTAAQPESKVFLTRPKMEGLWVRLTFRNQELMEGILSNNLLLIEPFGFSITPPEPFSNHQRVFVPRQALTEIQVLGVIGSPLRGPRRALKSKDQGLLFED